MEAAAAAADAVVANLRPLEELVLRPPTEEFAGDGALLLWNLRGLCHRLSLVDVDRGDSSRSFTFTTSWSPPRRGDGGGSK